MLATDLVTRIESMIDVFGDFDMAVSEDSILSMASTGELLPFQFNGARRKRFQERDCGYDTPCWVWLLSLLNGRPYLKVGTSQRKLNAYRWLYEQLVGPIPKGFVLHHRCENKMCVNPFHLEPKERGKHQSDHARGRKLNLSDAERERRRVAGRQLVVHVQGQDYKVASRSEAARKGWEKRRAA